MKTQCPVCNSASIDLVAFNKKDARAGKFSYLGKCLNCGYRPAWFGIKVNVDKKVKGLE